MAATVVTAVALAVGPCAAVGAAADDPAPQGSQQEVGSAAGREHSVSVKETRVGRGIGRAPRRADEELGPFARQQRKVRPFATGPNARGPFDDRSRKRIASKSGRNFDFFADADGRTQRRVATKRMNFKNDTGVWTPIDTDLVARDGLFRQKANDIDVDVGGHADATTLVSLGLNETQSVGQRLAGARHVPPAVEGSQAIYAGVLPDTDLRLTSLSQGVKETLVLRSAEAPTSWVFPLNLQGLTPRLTRAGAVEYVDSAGTVAATTPPGSMTDSNIDPATAEGARSNAVSYSLVSIDGKPALKVIADASWIGNKARKFPIEVDPTALVGGGPDTYVNSATPNTNYSGYSTLAVGTTANGLNKARSFMVFGGITNPPADTYTYSAEFGSLTRPHRGALIWLHFRGRHAAVAA